MAPTLKNKKLFCFGYGYVAQKLAYDLKEQDPSWEIAGTTRDMEKFRALKTSSVKPYLFDDNHPLDDPLSAMDHVTHVLISVPPDDQGDPVFDFHGEDLLALEHLEWIGLLSSTSVYGDRNGGIVNEDSELRPTSKRGSRRALAEAQWLSLYASERLPVHIFRLAGIYGPGRSALDAVRAGSTRRIDKPGHAFNRIHIDDISRILMASMKKPHPGHAYNVSDDNPSPSHEVIAKACELLGLVIPPVIPFDDVDQAPMARSFYLDNKRVSNKRIKDELDITLKYPDFHTGLPACMKDETNIQGPLSYFVKTKP